jgi:hypothetical protein
MPNTKGKAIVIGAGVSGLTAACILADKGFEVTVFEKEARPGGRVKSETFADGSKFETGATWVHDSSHPVAKVFSDTGGSYQDYNAAASEDGAMAALFNHYLIHPVESYFYNKLQKSLFEQHKFIKDLSWEKLIDNINDSSNQGLYVVKIRELLSSFPYNSRWFLNANPGDEAFKANFIAALNEMGISESLNSLTGEKYYAGPGDEHYLPHAGYSKVVDVLLGKAASKGIKIECGKSVTELTDGEVVANGERIKADLIVSAIPAFGYSGLTIKEKAEGSLSKESLESAVNHLAPSNMAKLVIKLTEKVDIDKLEYVSGVGTITTDGKSDIVYSLVPASSVQRPEEADAASQAILQHIKDNHGTSENLGIKEKSLSYADGKSWYIQTVGFDPVVNNEQIVYLGAVTGADDSVHSSITAACAELGVVDHNVYLNNLLGPLPEQVCEPSILGQVASKLDFLPNFPEAEASSVIQPNLQGSESMHRQKQLGSTKTDLAGSGSAVAMPNVDISAQAQLGATLLKAGKMAYLGARGFVARHSGPTALPIKVAKTKERFTSQLDKISESLEEIDRPIRDLYNAKLAAVNELYGHKRSHGEVREGDDRLEAEYAEIKALNDNLFEAKHKLGVIEEEVSKLGKTVKVGHLKQIKEEIKSLAEAMRAIESSAPKKKRGLDRGGGRQKIILRT